MTRGAIWTMLGVILASSWLLAHAGDAPGFGKALREMDDIGNATGSPNQDGNLPYVVVGGEWCFHGRYYAKCVPAKAEGTAGTTNVYRVGKEGDELLDTYEWYAPKQFKIGILVGAPVAGKVALMRMHDEATPFDDQRVELSFYFAGEHLKSYTVQDLAALDANLQKQNTGHKREWLGYSVAGNMISKFDQPAWCLFVAGGKKQIYVNARTGEVIPTESAK